MSYQKQKFMNHLHNNNYTSPGVYCNALDNVEKYLFVDIDAEYEKDSCESLYNNIQQIRRNPEQIGKSEHDVRTYASRLKKYIEFRQSENVENNLEKEFKLRMTEETFEKNIRKLIVIYKKEFLNIFREERYKWEAIKHYKDIWNIDDPNFADMLEQAFAKTFNLLTAGQYYAYKMLVKLSHEYPEDVRELFKILYDESLPLSERFDTFRFGFDDFIGDQKINHYQDLHAVSVYLTFEYPDKYSIYKYRVWADFLKNIGEYIPNIKGKHETFKIESSNEICDKILEFVVEERELCSIYQSLLDGSCYYDRSFRLLAFDIMFFGSYYNAENDEIIESVEEKLEIYTKTDFLKDVYISEEKYKTCVSRLKHKKNLILQGAPGVGKTFTARRLAWSVMGVKDDNRIKLVQFHQSYSYEDFIMGYKPDGNGFSLENGIFYDFCIKAKEDPNKDYFFIIDEINRGNMSKIFGELLMLIENDYRGMEITLAYDKKMFCVPENLYIIGMMNTADRSLAMIDYALRRRFSFVEMTPGFDSEGFEAYKRTINNNTFGKLVSRIKTLNADIESDASLGKGFCIGHSYFCGLKEQCSDAILKEIVEYDIIPMIEEYWFDDDAKAKNWTNDLRGVFNG